MTVKSFTLSQKSCSVKLSLHQRILKIFFSTNDFHKKILRSFLLKYKTVILIFILFHFYISVRKLKRHCLKLKNLKLWNGNGCKVCKTQRMLWNFSWGIVLVLLLLSFKFFTRGQTLMVRNPDTAFSSLTQNCMTDVLRQVRSKGIGDDERNERHCGLSDQSLEASFIRFTHTHSKLVSSFFPLMDSAIPA